MTPQTLALAWIAGTVALFVLACALIEIVAYWGRSQRVQRRLAQIRNARGTK